MYLNTPRNGKVLCSVADQAENYFLRFVTVVSCSEENEAPSLKTSFSADAASVTAGGSVVFTDLSTGNPMSWTWTFEGGTPAESSDQNPQVKYLKPGTYTVTLTAANIAHSDTETKVDFIGDHKKPWGNRAAIKAK